VVSNATGKEMILRFAAETEIDTSYAAWRLKTPIPYAIRAVTRVRTARLSMEDWVAFIERHPTVKSQFEFEIMKLMSEVMAHTITLHLLDAPGRVARFARKHAALVERLPKKELASYLNLSPETLSRLKRRARSTCSDALAAAQLSSAFDSSGHNSMTKPRPVMEPTSQFDMKMLKSPATSASTDETSLRRGRPAPTPAPAAPVGSRAS
jgi:hypothetical protein